MSDPVQIEPIIETSVRAALRGAMNAVPKVADPFIPITAFWLPPEQAPEGQPPLDRKATIPGVWVTCHPYLPNGAEAAVAVYPAGKCDVDILVRVNPDQDIDASLFAALWNVVRNVIYKHDFSLDATGISFGGVVINAPPRCGVDEHGQFAAVTMEVNITID